MPRRIRGGRKARGVADDAAADGNQRAAAVGAGADERFVDPRDRLQVLEALAVGDQDRLAAAERALHLRAVEAPDDGARHDEPARPDALRVEQRGQAIDDAFADQDGRRAIAGLDVDADGLIGGCRHGRALTRRQEEPCLAEAEWRRRVRFLSAALIG